jgi:hypothetical protein
MRSLQRIQGRGGAATRACATATYTKPAAGEQQKKGQGSQKWGRNGSVENLDR